jgi:hypothetical protein
MTKFRGEERRPEGEGEAGYHSPTKLCVIPNRYVILYGQFYIVFTMGKGGEWAV